VIASLKPYPEYKDTGLPWLGKVPKHWEVLPNRALFFEVKEREHPDEEMLSVTITQGVIRQRSLLAETAKKDSSNLDKSAYKLVCPGDIAYNKMRAWQGAIGASTLRGIISPAYVVMRLRDPANLPRYFHFLFRTSHFAKEAERWSYGITSDMWSLRPEHFKMIYAPQPPPSEQQAIVRFLDWAGGRVERAVRAKWRLIALLQELKQVLIHRAVTGQVDVRTGQPYPAYNPSGIPWLGNIPRHWEVKRMKFAAMLNPPKSESRLVLQNNPIVTFLPMERVGTDGQFDCREQVEASAVSNGFTYFRRGDILLAKITPCFENGKGAHLEDLPTEIGFGSTEFHVLRARAGLIPRFLFYQTRDYIFRDLGARTMTGSAGQQRVPVSFVADYPCLLPPPTEQLEIVRAVAAVSHRLTTALTRLERETELLRELRTRLVADVVTGQWDVRALAERLPAEPPPEAEAPAAEEELSDESDWSDEEQPATLPP
jgi:type I restriction enzyme S subunit